MILRLKVKLNACSSYELAIGTVVEKLVGRNKFKSHSPVDPFCGKDCPRY